MNDPDIFKSRCADWAQGLEIVSHGGSSAKHKETVTVEDGSVGLVGAIFAPTSLLPPTGVELTVKGPEGVVLNREEDDENRYVHLHGGKLNAFAVSKPKAGPWELEIDSPTGQPYALDLSAFKKRPSVAEIQYWQSLAASGGPLTLRCMACKFATKALAAVIGGAALHIAFPHALIAIVAAHLGNVGTDVAQAFLTTLLGFSKDEIAERLCKAIQLC